jgi:hypothetical protein
LAGVIAAHPAEATAKPAADAREMLSNTDDFLKILRFTTKPSNPASRLSGSRLLDIARPGLVGRHG